MRELIWQCLAKAKALDMLIAYGFGGETIASLSFEVSRHLEDVLEMYDRDGFEEREGGAE